MKGPFCIVTWFFLVLAPAGCARDALAPPAETPRAFLRRSMIDGWLSQVEDIEKRLSALPTLAHSPYLYREANACQDERVAFVQALIVWRMEYVRLVVAVSRTENAITMYRIVPSEKPIAERVEKSLHAWKDRMIALEHASDTACMRRDVLTTCLQIPRPRDRDARH